MKQALLGGLLLVLATDALAHRLDEYLQATRIAVATNRIDLSFDLTPGVAVADQLLDAIDQNRDGQISMKESTKYAQRFLKDIQLGLDQKHLELNLAEVSFPSLSEVRGGLGVIQIKAAALVGPLVVGSHILTLANTHQPTISVYQVNALRPKDAAIAITKQTRDELQKNYRLEFTVSRSSP